MTRDEFREAIQQIMQEVNCNYLSIGKCSECPLHCANDIGCGNVEDIFDIIDDVEDWVEKHRDKEVLHVKIARLGPGTSSIKSP